MIIGIQHLQCWMRSRLITTDVTVAIGV